MTTRYDVSAVPLQGGYVAKQCPVRAQNDALAPAEPVPPSPMLERLFRRGNAFEAEVLASIVGLHPGAAVIDAEDAPAREQATVEAMRAGLSPILSARLPADLAGRRVGKPDLLVAAPGGGYRAVDVKHHLSLEPTRANTSQLVGLCSGLGDLSLEAAVVDEEYSARKRSDDLLQLAHYQRMLEAAGFAASGVRRAGIVGREQRVVWYDLDAPIWRTPSLSEKTKCRSTIERYDFEFDFRLDIIAVADRHRVDQDVELLVVPVRCSECPDCPWWGYCRPQLEAGAGDVSLLPGVGWSQWKRHHDRGVTDRAALAALDVPTARLVAANIDVAALQAATTDAPSEARIATAIDDPSGRAASLLHAEGLTTVGELRALDPVTALYLGSGLTALPDQIDLARAAIAPEPAFRRRGLTEVSVPRADVEVDVDMESVEEGCYLWGTLTNDRAGSGLAPNGYRPFAAPWVPLTAEAEAQNSLRFWRWLMGLRTSAHAAGLTFRAYCYHANAENTYLRRLAIAGAISEEVEAFIGSEDWVDMLRVFDSQFLTGRASGLKVVAPLVGFHWDVDDAGGTESMVEYDLAVGAPTQGEREVAKEWLLRYNRGDVEATRHLREGIVRESRLAPTIESLDPRGWS